MKTKKEMIKKRKARIRARLTGTSARPRLAVYRSNTMLLAQIIDDERGETIVSQRSTEGKNTVAAQKLGVRIAKAAKEKRISHVVFDRGGYLYHGRVKAVADAARQAGLQF